MMEDFGHGIVDSRHRRAARPSSLARRLVGARGARVVATAQPHRPRVTPVLTLVIALMVNYLAGRHYARGDWTRAQLYALSDKTVNVLQHLPRPVDAYVFMYPGRDSERARALGGMVRELSDRFARYAPAKFHAEVIDPDRNPARAEASRRSTASAATRWGRG